MDTNSISRTASCVLICMLLPVFTGCAVLRNFPHNYTCPPNRSLGDNTCPPDDNYGEGPVLGEVLQPQPVAAAAHWEEMESVQKQIETLTETDGSLQEQLGILDSNAEKQRAEREESMQEIRDLASQMKSMRRELETHKVELEEVEADLTLQRQKNDEVLASVEKQLIDVLRDYN